ncbi:SDR family oxidoreductase [Mucilaginibacter auburnensis]|uniref:Enoyl-[acyl-carrier protein] reductase I n=1 Tax=Mucilaginibacter auburnensis TaxID=1457233 RepID=A0A2H9VMG5_9SPHI|nr:SDR family oxidoreductase [Mucilaginibacter auburnensis]PJJ79529.1 enoyl-[acyl-carrier protein] reductase I [Mucilaginibacter auburnensis]
MQNNTKQFSGLWTVILGGSSGFGFATAEKLASHGMNVAVLYREMGASDKIVKQKLTDIATTNNVEIEAHNINALDETVRNNFISAFVAGKKNKVRLLLHSIARGNLKPLAGDDGGLLSVDDIQLTTYAMATSMLDWARDLLTAEVFCADARVIGLTSEGSHKYWDGYAAVSIAKASLESLNTYMAVELAPYGLKTNLIQAGVTATPSLKRIPESDRLIEGATQRNPFKRLTKPDDVANVIYLLCTDEAAWINGSVIHVDGGEHCR